MRDVARDEQFVRHPSAPESEVGQRSELRPSRGRESSSIRRRPSENPKPDDALRGFRPGHPGEGADAAAATPGMRQRVGDEDHGDDPDEGAAPGAGAGDVDVALGGEADLGRGHARGDENVQGVLHGGLLPLRPDLREDPLAVQGHRAPRILQPAREASPQPRGLALGLHGPELVGPPEGEEHAAERVHHCGLRRVHEAVEPPVSPRDAKAEAEPGEEAAPCASERVDHGQAPRGLQYQREQASGGHDPEARIAHQPVLVFRASQLQEQKGAAGTQEAHEHQSAHARPEARHRRRGCEDRLVPALRKERLVHTPDTCVDAASVVRNNQHTPSGAQRACER
mmetsp:Transcript_98755/g.283754  ORF Transcript_98755/g.283754 Transcript_98755/m.283754 type:complete len:340 (+) Transcript_98755:415-1434(+)